MIAAAATQREARRLRQVRRTGARHPALAHISPDETPHQARRGTWRSRPGAAGVEPAPRGRVPREPAAQRPVSRPQMGIASDDDQPPDVSSPPRQVLPDRLDHDLLEGDDEAPVTASLTLARVIQRFGAAYRQRHGRTITAEQDRVMRELTACYTPLMGTHQWSCQECGTVVELPNACHNRHCPCCGDAQRQKWAASTASQLLPVRYYHVILTVPRQITQLALANPRVLYPILLSSGAEAILRGGRKLFQAELALLSLLHSWGSVVNPHLHSHSVLPAGGLGTKGLAWIGLAREQIEDLLLLVSTLFPRRFLQALRTAHARGRLRFDGTPELEGRESPAAFERWLASFNTQRWVIRCPEVWDRRQVKENTDGVIQTVKYLARYANRVALSNDRLVGIEGNQVLLRYKDYRDGGCWKTKQIEGVEFIGRFLQHLLPRGLQHIRRYGWMARRAHNEKLQFLRQYFCMSDPETKPEDAERDEAEPGGIDDEPSRPCRYCPGRMVLTDRTCRPSVRDILRMPLAWFDHVQAGAIVTLGAHVQDAAAGGGKTTASFTPREREKAEARCEPGSRPASAYL